MYTPSPNNPNSAGSDGSTNYPGQDSSTVTSPNTNSSGQIVLDDGSTVVDTTPELAELVLQKIQDLADLTVQTKTIPYGPSFARDTYGPNYYKPLTGATGADANTVNSSSLTSKFPVYRIFFKGLTEPTDIMTQSVWSICRHQGITAGVGNEAGFYQRAAKMTSLHFAGNKHPWNPLILPANPIRGSGSAQISNGSATMGDNYMPLENVEAVFHRNIIQGAANISHSGDNYGPEVIKSNAYRVHLKSGGTFDLNAGGYTITSQPTLRMIKPDGNFDTVEKIARPTKPLVYFYSYGGQYYTGDHHNTSTFTGTYPANNQSFNYSLRTGLASSAVGHWADNDSSALTGLLVDGTDGNYSTNVTDPAKGNPLSLDTGATYLPLENVSAITKLNSGDTGYSLNSTTDLNSSNLLPYQTYVRDAQNNPSPLLNMDQGDNGRGYTNVYQPADAGASTLITE